MSSFPLNIESYTQVKPETEDRSTAHKLWDECYLVTAGTASGAAQQARLAFDHPNDAVAKLGTGLAAGVVFAALQRQAGVGRLFAESVGFSMGCNMALDFSHNVSNAAPAIMDTWNSSSNYEHNKGIIAGSLGKYAFDTSVMTAGSMIGATGFKLAIGTHKALPQVSDNVAVPNGNAIEKGARLQMYATEETVKPLEYKGFNELQAAAGPGHRAIPSLSIVDGKLNEEVKVVDAGSPTAKLYDAVEPSILRMRWTDGKNGGVGTAFPVGEPGEGYLATAHHMIRPATDGTNRDFFVRINGQDVPVTPVASDASADVALVKLQNQQIPEPPPLQFGWTQDLVPRERLNAFGYPALSYRVAMTDGILDRIYAKIDCPDTDVKALAAAPMDTVRIATEAQTWHGNSGGPLINARKEVVGIITSGTPETGQSFSTSVEHLRWLLQQARANPLATGIECHTLGQVLGEPGAKDFTVRAQGFFLAPNPIVKPGTLTLEVPLLRPTVPVLAAAAK